MKKISFCPGCGHIPIAKAVEKILQENNGILVGSVGCSVSIVSDFENVDAVSSQHGAALAVATGIRRVCKDKKVIITYQGDGDLGNIGIGELIHTCLRNENIICVLINNSVYGMTGFQMSSTTPIGVKTKTCVDGRTIKDHGIPINFRRITKAVNPEIQYFLCHSASKEGIDRFKECLKMGIENRGFTLIEVISPCVTFFKTPKEAYEDAKKRYKEMNI